MSRYSVVRAKTHNKVLSIKDEKEGFYLNFEKHYPYRKEGDIRYFKLLTPNQSIDLEAEFFDYSEKFRSETVGWNSADYLKRKKDEGCRRISISPNSKIKKREITNKVIDLFLYYDETTIGCDGINYRIIIFNETQRVKVYE